jgi:hypothetical protein
MYGLNESGDTCSITITDFQPFFYIKVGDHWDQNTASKLLTHLKQKVKYMSDSILSCKVIDYSKLYGFTGGKKSRFCLVTFSNISTFNKVKNLWYEYDSETNQRKSKPLIFDNVKLILYESAIPPLLRYFHIQNISPSGWVFIQTNKCSHLDRKLTTCKYEYVCSHKYLKAQPEKETLVPYKICSFDIEASSSHGDFPLPKKTYKRLSSNILDIFESQSKATKENKVKVLQLITKIIKAAFGYDKFNDVDIIYPKNQPSKEDLKQLISKFTSDTITLDSIESSEETIEKLFERIKESANLEVEAAEGDSDMEDDDVDVKAPVSKKNKTKMNIKKMITQLSNSMLITKSMCKFTLLTHQILLWNYF